MLKLKQIATISVLTLVMTGCVSPNKDTVFAAETVVSKPVLVVEETPDIMEIARLDANARKINKMISGLKKHVNKTWYVFSGSTPRGWDCSGLTKWTYEQVGVELEHRASKQELSGTKTKTPKPGDLVIFKYKNSKTAYHVGVYIGNGEMIHAPRKGEVTRIESISQFGGNYSKITYVDVLMDKTLKVASK
jgi:cell wall-associated NlpC family hydrolase